MAGLDGDDTSSTIYIDDLNPVNPEGDDAKSQGDNHLRFIKRVLKNTFSNVTGPVTATHTELNTLDGITATTAQLNGTTQAMSATSGYIALQGGLYLQWGSFSSSGTSVGNATVTFGTAFPTACLVIVGNVAGTPITGTSYDVIFSTLSTTTAIGTARVNETPANNLTVRWIAIGF